MSAGSCYNGPMRRLALLVLVWCSLLAGCARSGPDLAEGRLRLADTVDIRTLDTAIGYDTASWKFERLINDGLLNYADADATLVPAVARALPEVVDGRRFTFHLRDDVYFHNGRRVVAEDFRYALLRVLDPKTASPARGLYENIVGAKAFSEGHAKDVPGLRCPDERTFEVELERPDLAFLNVITMPFAYAIPREEVEKYTLAEWPRHAVGCGPYRLTKWEPGVRIRVERFDRFYDSSRGKVNVVEQRFGVPDYMQLMMFERGQIDVSGIPMTDFERITRDPRFKPMLRSIDENAVYYASMNCEIPPFDKKAVRQAFNYAIDRQRIYQLQVGTIKVAQGVLPPGMPGYDPTMPSYAYDPERAKALLAKAGFPEGLEVEMTTRDRPAERRIAESMQADLAKVGVKCSVRSITFPQWLDLAGARGKMPFTINAWFQDYPDPSNFLDILLNGRRITDEHCENRSFYNNPTVTRLLDQAAQMTDAKARLALYGKIERLVVDDAPWIFLYYPTRYVLVQPWVKGYQLHPVWSSREDKVSLQGSN